MPCTCRQGTLFYHILPRCGKPTRHLWLLFQEHFLAYVTIRHDAQNFVVASGVLWLSLCPHHSLSSVRCNAFCVT